MMTNQDTPLPDLNWMPMPAMLIAADRSVLVANEPMKSVYPISEVGRDVSLIVRDPNFLDCLDQVIKTGKPRESQISRTRQAERHFNVWIRPLNGFEKIYLVHMFETTTMVEAEKMRSTFVADVSHELRSPLTTMIATLETLKGRAGNDENTRARFIDMTAAEASRMHRIVNDLLALSATEARKHIPPSDAVALKPVLESIAKLSSERLAAKRMVIRTELDDTLDPVMGDQDELTQVFQNLIDNAINYGDSVSEIVVGLYLADDGESQIATVNNMGSVIKPQHIPRLTERFYRADSSRSRHLGGTGLGLAIVKHILSRHGGRLLVESNEEDGTTFSVVLPVVP